MTKGSTNRFGYGAQELLPIIPEAVYKMSEEQTYSVDYTQVHTVLIDELIKRVQALEEELKNIKI